MASLFLVRRAKAPGTRDTRPRSLNSTLPLSSSNEKDASYDHNDKEEEKEEDEEDVMTHARLASRPRVSFLNSRGASSGVS
jgi:hypothetical protein